MRKLLLVCGVLVLFSCKKEEVMPATPEITLLDAAPGLVHEFQDRVTLRFSYKDGDGDLGQSDPDDYSLWVKDSRLANTDGYHIPPLAPLDSEVPIQGQLEVELTTLFLLGSSGEEVMTYTFQIVDRAGNRSNSITTPPITIVADSLGGE